MLADQPSKPTAHSNRPTMNASQRRWFKSPEESGQRQKPRLSPWVAATEQRKGQQPQECSIHLELELPQDSRFYLQGTARTVRALLLCQLATNVARPRTQQRSSHCVYDVPNCHAPPHCRPQLTLKPYRGGDPVDRRSCTSHVLHRALPSPPTPLVFPNLPHSLRPPPRTHTSPFPHRTRCFACFSPRGRLP